jgi:aconitase A
VPKDIRPQQDLTLVIHRKDGTRKDVSRCSAGSTRRSRSTTTTAGGILPFVLRDLWTAAA